MASSAISCAALVVPRLHLIPGVRHKIVDSTTPALHRGALVLRPRGRRQLAGRLCPNPVLAEGKRLRLHRRPAVRGRHLGAAHASQRDELTAPRRRRRDRRLPGTELAVVAANRPRHCRRHPPGPDGAVRRARRKPKLCSVVPSCPAGPPMRKPAGVPVLRAEPVLARRRSSTRTRTTPACGDLGPVVWLTKQRVYAVPRYAECKAVLRDDKTFISGEGVGLNPLVNRLSRGTTLNSDGDEHDQRRKLVAHRLLPRALRAMSDVIASQADQLVAAAVSTATCRRRQGSGDRAAVVGGTRPRRLARRRPQAPSPLGRSHIRRAGPDQPDTRRRRCRPACRCCASPNMWCAAAR